MVGALRNKLFRPNASPPRFGQEYTHVSQDDDRSFEEPSQPAKIENEKSGLIHLVTGNCTIAAMLLALLGITIMAGSIALVFRHNAVKSHEAKESHSTFLPHIASNTPVVFQPDYRYWNMSDFNSEQAWRALGRHGGIYIKDPEQYGLSPGIEEEGDYEQYPISVFHQLHCLRILREHFVAFLGGHLMQKDDVANHVEHCFDYLRQAISCGADLTLEKARVDPDGRRRATDGWGTTHYCKSWNTVEDVQRENRWKYAI